MKRFGRVGDAPVIGAAVDVVVRGEGSFVAEVLGVRPEHVLLTSGDDATVLGDPVVVDAERDAQVVGHPVQLEAGGTDRLPAGGPQEPGQHLGQ